VQHVGAARIAMEKLSARPSVCLSVRRVPVPYYTRHLITLRASSIVTKLNSSSIGPEYGTLQNVNLRAVRRLATIA